MEAAIDQIKAIASSADEALHRRLVDAVRQLLYAVERPEDMTHRLIFGHFQLAVARVGQDTKLVEVLVKNGDATASVEDIASQSDMSPLLAGRILRYMSCFGMVREVASDRFAANKNTEALDAPVVRAGVGFGIDIVSPSAQALPNWLKKNDYQSPDSIRNCPWHPEHDSKLNAMQFLHSNPPVLRDFNTFMTHQRLDSHNWLDSYLLDLQASEPVFFVDIGGGVGHQCIALKERYPNKLGRVVLQDVPATINKLSANESFEPMVHDYFTEQPMKGAKYYYFRNIMHNLPDEGCKTVLLHTKAVLGPNSKILIDDIVVPGQGAHWRTAQLDMLMMSALGAIERTEQHWQDLMASVGLKISKTYVYDSVSRDAVMEIVPI